MAETPSHEWRTPLYSRLLFPALGLYILAVTVGDLGGKEPVYTGLSVVLGAAFVVGPFLPVVRLQEDAVLARGLFVGRNIPLREIESVGPGYGGLELRTRDGARFLATGVGERFDWRAWTGRSRPAGGAAEVILAARDGASGDGPRGR